MIAAGGGNIGLCVARDALSFYLFFALMSFASYGLVVHTPHAGGVPGGPRLHHHGRARRGTGHCGAAGPDGTLAQTPAVRAPARRLGRRRHARAGGQLLLPASA
jgi:hypothetical protein